MKYSGPIPSSGRDLHDICQVISTLAIGRPCPSDVGSFTQFKCCESQIQDHLREKAFIQQQVLNTFLFPG